MVDLTATCKKASSISEFPESAGSSRGDSEWWDWSEPAADDMDRGLFFKFEECDREFLELCRLWFGVLSREPVRDGDAIGGALALTVRTEFIDTSMLSKLRWPTSCSTLRT